MVDASYGDCVQELKSQLFSTEANERSAAAYRLAFVVDQDVIPILLHALRDTDPKVRDMAIFAIREIGLGEAAYGEDYGSLLCDANPAVRACAVSCIEQLRGEDSRLAEQVVQLFDDIDVGVRLMADLVLRRTEYNSLCEALRLRELLMNDLILVLSNRHNNKWNRVCAVFGLAQYGPDSISVLDHILRSDERVLCRAALLILGKMGPEAMTVVDPRRYTGDDEMRRYAVRSLGEIGGSDALPILVSMLRDLDAGVRSDASFALSGIKDNRGIATRALLERFDDEDTESRLSAIMALGSTEVRTPEVAFGLVSALNQPDHSVRTQAMESLIQLWPHSENALSYLRDALTSLDTPLTAINLDAMCRFLLDRSAKPTARLLGESLRDESVHFRRFAVVALAESSLLSAEVVRNLAESLHDQDEIVRFWSATALESLGNLAEPAFSSLVNGLRDSSSSVQAASARAIGNIGHASVAIDSALQELINRTNSLVRFFATEALSKIYPSSEEALHLLSDFVLHCPDSTHRRKAIEAIGKMNLLTCEVVHILKTAACDIDLEVRRAAQECLDRIRDRGDSSCIR